MFYLSTALMFYWFRVASSTLPQTLFSKGSEVYENDAELVKTYLYLQQFYQ